MSHRIILIHGIFSMSLLMRPFAGYLRHETFETTLWGYRTLGCSVLDHAARLRDFLQPLAELDEPTYFVTHSMGGVVLRAALDGMCWKSPGRVVMLSPPNHGSYLATIGARFLFWASPALADISDAPKSLVRRLPELDQWEIGVIAGSRDLLVPQESTQLRCQTDFILMHCGHNRMMFHRPAMREAVYFFRHGLFSVEATRPS